MRSQFVVSQLKEDNPGLYDNPEFLTVLKGFVVRFKSFD